MPSNEHEGAERNAGVAKPVERTFACRPYAAYGLALAVYAAFLAYRALSEAGAVSTSSVSVWELYDAGQLLMWLRGLVLAGCCQFALFIPFGFLAVLSIVRRPVGSGLLAVAGVVGVAIAAVVAQLWWGLGAAIALVLAWLGSLLGIWIGSTWQRGPRARLWLLPKIMLMASLAAAGLGALLWLAIESEPLPFEAATVTSARKRELVRLVRSKSPRSLQPGQIHTLRLTEQDVNVLLAWGLSIGADQSKARAVFDPNQASLAVSVPVTLAGRQRYVNLQLTGDMGVMQGHLRLGVQRFRLGRLEVPAGLVNLWRRPIASLIRADGRAEPVFDAIEFAGIGSGWIEATYGRVDLPPGFREDLFGPSWVGDDVLVATRVQVEHLLAMVRAQPRPEPVTFELCFESVFSLARERSIDGDPVAENRAAIFALGVLLGHRRLEEFLGPVLPGQGGRPWTLQRVPLRGRTDWTKHFCLSAAIALLSDASVSDAAGLLKEELDAGAGGSGFSFADLLADRAGTTFAVHATRSATSARALQERIAGGFEVDDVFPPATGLPEGIGDAELQSRYGGVGGREYLRLVEDIERRVASCEAYR